MLQHVLKSSLFFFSAILYISLPDKTPTLELAILKLLPIISLVIFAVLHVATHGTSRFTVGVIIGLIFSGIGDYFLVYKETHFVYGVFGFAVAQLVYGITFGCKPFKPAVLLLCVIAGSIMYKYIYPGLSSKFVPIIAAYVVLIYFMAWRALARFQLKRWTWGQMFCALGAVSFIISDFVIAVDKFRHEIPHRHLIVVVTYFIAQYGITMAITDYPSKPRTKKKMK
ncbi:lysoplasmalogenase TMEM86A-like [Saccoglossus kowalevskii]|uniref:lysoplasmalogenase n=1 Tax=Saccoglossus kowalevskii TaxID=10224 RepID=A0ABM0LWU3_SACKO|nr:PREDICTED: lysoplasmalogenase-like protein TMEM86A-like [Saccoglossus kowalevskii]